MKTPIRFAAAFLAAACLTAGAQALAFTGTLALPGKELTKLARCGKQKDAVTVVAEIREDGTWNASNLAGVESLAGSWVEANRKGTKLELTPDAASLAALDASLQASASELCEEPVTTTPVEVEKLLLKLNRKETRAKLTARLGFEKSEADGTRRGRYTASAKARIGEGNAVAAALATLGVETGQSPPLDDDGVPYPESYSPFGQRVLLTSFVNDEGVADSRIGGAPELFTLGLHLGSAPGPALQAIDGLAPTGGPLSPDVLYERDGDWLREEPSEARSTLRDAVPADVDGDGLEEIVIARNDELGRGIELLTIDVDADGSPETTHLLALPTVELPLRDIRLAVGDFDGDFVVEFAVVYTPDRLGAPSTLLLVDDAAGLHEVLDRLLLMPDDPTRTTHIVLEAGNLDHDASDELVVIENQIEPAGSNANVLGASARFSVFDDLGTELAELAGGTLVDQLAGGGVLVVADAAIGDWDGDRIGEIAFGGLTEIAKGCEAEHLYIVLDDAVHGLEQLESSHSLEEVPNCNLFHPPTLQFVHTNLLDLDGDRDLELQLNQYVFDATPPVDGWRNALSIHDEAIFERDGQDLVYDRSRGTMAVGDFDGDGRDDLVTFREDDHRLRFWHWTGDPGSAVSEPLGVIVADDAAAAGNPIVAAIEVEEDDTQVLQYAGEHQVIFTEPVVLAALASPPCSRSNGQNWEACTTTWGQHESIGGEAEYGVTLSIGASVGQEVDGGVITQSGFEWKATLTFAATATISRSYEVTKEISYSTGALEDGVVFTTIPMDRYVYEIVSHPDADQVGQQWAIHVPREPITLIAEREFYNASVQPGSVQIDEAVFRHQPGVIDSYPTEAEGASVLLEELFAVETLRLLAENPTPAGLGLSEGPISVGQGGGETEVALSLDAATDVGASFDVSFSAEVETTVATVKVGLELGRTDSFGSSVTRGEGTSYVGTVGSLDAASFAAERYSYGLFSYLHHDPATGQEFEVINYWVER